MAEALSVMLSRLARTVDAMTGLLAGSRARGVPAPIGSGDAMVAADPGRSTTDRDRRDARRGLVDVG